MAELTIQACRGDARNGPTVRLDVAVVAAALQPNVLAGIGLTAELLPPMLPAGWARSVSISSGIVAHPEMMVGTLYAATEAAVEAHTINLAAELTTTGTTANLCRPGAVDAAMQERIGSPPPDQIGAALHERFVDSHAQGTPLTPERSAASLLARLSEAGTAQIWDVACGEMPS